jgi:transposase-like protein
MAKKRVAADWEKIEQQYRVGQLSVREIARQHDVSESAVRKKAKERNWQRDLTKKVREKVRSKLVRKEVRTQTATDEEIAEAAADIGAEVVTLERKDISAGRTLAMSLLDELAGMTDNKDDYDKLGELMKDGAESVDRLNEAYRKVISMPQRVDAMKKLAETLKTLIALERQAYSLDDDGSTGGMTHEEMLEQLR